MKRKVLCYGDSLTAGYCEYGSVFTPYGDMITRLSDVEVLSVGMSGWTTGEMVDAAAYKCNEDCVGHVGDGLQRLLKDNSFDVVCLMAGTNDLGTGVELEEIVSNLKALVDLCYSSSNPNVFVVLLTVPPTGGDQYESVRRRRTAINDAIKVIVNNHGEKAFLIDAASILSNPGEHPEVPTPESLLWDSDLLHLSPLGSEKLGTYVHGELKALGLLG